MTPTLDIIDRFTAELGDDGAPTLRERKLIIALGEELFRRDQEIENLKLELRRKRVEVAK